jgi:hypothetical protein
MDQCIGDNRRIGSDEIAHELELQSLKEAAQDD